MTIDEMLQPQAAILCNEDTIAQLLSEVRRLRADLDNEGNGALAYIAAIVLKSGGRMELSNKDMVEGLYYSLERAERPDGGMILQAVKPQELALAEFNPVIAKPDMTLAPNG